MREARSSGLIPEQNPLAQAQSLVDSGHRSIILLGPPRTSKSHWGRQIAAAYLRASPDDLADRKADFLRLEFHRETRYQDIVERRTASFAGGELTFKTELGTLANFLKDRKGRAVVVIEEANRADLSAVLGELFQVVERGYRGESVTTAGGESISIPPDVLLLLTMNSIDRSTYPLDMALLGRFRVVKCDFSMATAREILADSCNDQEIIKEILTRFESLRDASHYPFGHAYLVGLGGLSQFQELYMTVLRPTLEVFYGGESVAEIRLADQAMDFSGE